MDIIEAIGFIILIFVFYIFVIYQFFRIICQKLGVKDIISKIKYQKVGVKNIKSKSSVEN